MNAKGKYDPYRWKSTNKYWDWDEWKHEFQENGKQVHRMERRLAKQDLKRVGRQVNAMDR